MQIFINISRSCLFISSGCFKGLYKLNKIDLSFNHLYASQEVFTGLPISPDCDFKSKHLSLQNNGIGGFQWTAYDGLVDSIDLSFNFIKKLKIHPKIMTDFNLDKNIISFNLSHNEMAHLTIYCEKNQIFDNFTISLDNNPIQCDCHLDELFQLGKNLQISIWTSDKQVVKILLI